MTWIQTFSRQDFRPGQPTSNKIILSDIWVSLSRQVRYFGHTRLPYTVAQHSVLVYDLVKQKTDNTDLLIAALFHDAHEAYLSDIPTPIKQLLGEGQTKLKELETQIDEAVAERVAINPNLFNDPLIKHADASALYHEKHHLYDDIKFENNYWDWHTILKGEKPIPLYDKDFFRNIWNSVEAEKQYRAVTLSTLTTVN